ncbi:MAG: hypothetical protein AAGA62_06830 [Bacteroidota bacterium]
MIRKYYTCPACQAENRLRTFAPDRVSLEREQGEYFTANCRYCGASEAVHVDRVIARPNYLPAYLVSALCALLWIIIVLFGLYKNLMILLACTSLIGLPFAVRSAIDKAVATFNDYKIGKT